MTTVAAIPTGGFRRRLDPATVRGFGGILAFAAFLEIVPRSGLVSARYLPPTSAMIVSLVDECRRAAFWEAVGYTAWTWALGLAISVVLGALLGALIGSSKWLVGFTHSTIEFLRPIPSVAMIPLAVLLYGTRIQSVLLLVVYASVWMVLIQVLSGVQSIDPVARQTARSYRLSRYSILRDLIWPTILPFLMTGIRIAAGVALIIAITAELVIGAPGLGREIEAARAGAAVDTMYAYVIVAGLFGVSVNLLFRGVEKRLLVWQRQKSD